jgi:hypothetical protein
VFRTNYMHNLCFTSLHGETITIHGATTGHYGAIEFVLSLFISCFVFSVPCLLLSHFFRLLTDQFQTLHFVSALCQFHSLSTTCHRLSPGVRHPGREAEYSTPPNAEVKNCRIVPLLPHTSSRRGA